MSGELYDANTEAVGYFRPGGGNATSREATDGLVDADDARGHDSALLVGTTQQASPLGAATARLGFIDRVTGDYLGDHAAGIGSGSNLNTRTRWVEQCPAGYAFIAQSTGTPSSARVLFFTDRNGTVAYVSPGSSVARHKLDIEDRCYTASGVKFAPQSGAVAWNRFADWGTANSVACDHEGNAYLLYLTTVGSPNHPTPTSPGPLARKLASANGDEVWSFGEAFWSGSGSTAADAALPGLVDGVIYGGTLYALGRTYAEFTTEEYDPGAPDQNEITSSRPPAVWAIDLGTGAGSIIYEAPDFHAFPPDTEDDTDQISQGDDGVIDVDEAGDLYIATVWYESGTVRKLSAGGGEVWKFDTSGTRGVAPRGLTVAEDGVYVTGPRLAAAGNQTIWKLDRETGGVIWSRDVTTFHATYALGHLWGCSAGWKNPARGS